MAETDRTRLLDLLLAHYEELASFLTRRFGSPATTRDTLHDTYLRLQRIQTVPALDNPRAYLFRVASNIALDRVRVAQRDEQRLLSEDFAADKASEAPPADVTMDRQERLHLLAQAIAELPPRRREAFLLHKIDGLTHAQVAARLGMSRSMVEKHIMKAMAHCRDRLVT